MFVSLSLVTPLVAPTEPALLEDGTFSFLPAVVDGLPWWAFKAILMTLIPMLTLTFGIAKIPTGDPMEDEAALAKKGVDVDIVMLTPKELGRRTSYDETNTLVQRRRSSISTTMQEMGINRSAPEAAVDSSKASRLSSLVYAIDLEDVLEDVDVEDEN